jgi:hypothetical protein
MKFIAGLFVIVFKGDEVIEALNKLSILIGGDYSEFISSNEQESCVKPKQLIRYLQKILAFFAVVIQLIITREVMRVCINATWNVANGDNAVGVVKDFAALIIISELDE